MPLWHLAPNRGRLHDSLPRLGPRTEDPAQILRQLNSADKRSPLTPLEGYHLAVWLRRDRLGELVQALADSHSPRFLRESVHLLWTGMQYPQDYVPTELWAEAFQAARFRTDGALDTPPSSITLYRGAMVGRARRMAWTAVPVRATMYASIRRNLSQEGRVWTCTFRAADVLARIHEMPRHQTQVPILEYVVRPEAVAAADLTVHQTIPPRRTSPGDAGPLGRS